MFFALNIKIGLLKIRNVLFGVMRLLLFLVIVKELYGCGGVAKRLMNRSVFDKDRKDILNLYFRVISVGIKKVSIIFR